LAGDHTNICLDVRQIRENPAQRNQMIAGREETTTRRSNAETSPRERDKQKAPLQEQD
jgi:hypothetical protein